MISCYIDTLKIHDVNDPACPYFISNELQGLEFPTLRVASMNKAGTDGILISDVLLGERRFSLPGTALGLSDLTTFMNIRKQFLAMQAPIKDANGKLVKRVIKFTMEDGVTYRLLSQVVGVTFPQKYMLNADFMIDCLADSLLVENNTPTTTVGGTATVNGFLVPTLVPIVTTGGFNGDTTVINNGTYPISPVITLQGPLTNPQVYNKTTGILMQLSTTLGVSDKLVIDMNNKTVVLNGQTNRLNTKTQASRFWNLQVGSNVINLSSSISSETGTMTIVSYDGYLGV